MDKTLRMKELVNKLNEASNAYYNGKDEIMSNHEWDTMFDELVQLEKETGVILPDSPHKKLVQMRLVEMDLRKSNMNFRRYHLIRQRIFTNFQKFFQKLLVETVL